MAALARTILAAAAMFPRHAPCVQHARSMARAAADLPDYGSARLDRLLAHATGLSRKEVNVALRKGRVVVDGAAAKDGAKHVPLGGQVAVLLDGEPLEIRPPPLLVAYHKPLGVHSTMADERGRADLSRALALPPLWVSALHPVGRLDADTSGLLLFCSDGAVTQRLLHPRYGTRKEYRALVSGSELDDGGAALRATLAAGVATTEGVHVADLIEVRALSGADADAAAASTTAAFAAAGLRQDEAVGRPVAELLLAVTEGKHRMVRRMLANAGHPVEALHRVRFGAIELDPHALPPGACAPVEGEALAWAEALRDASAPGSVRTTASEP